jgi:hypothetical protein
MGISRYQLGIHIKFTGSPLPTAQYHLIDGSLLRVPEGED